MFEEFRKHSTLPNLLIILLICAVGMYLFQFVWQFLSFFSDIIVILVTAWVVSFILGPFVEKLQAFTRLPKSIAAGIIFTLFFGIFAIAIISFIPAVTAQIDTLGKVLPKYQQSFPVYVNKITTSAVSLVDNSLSFIPSVAVVLADIVFVLIVSFYFVVDKERINKEFYSLLPKKWHAQARYFQEVIDTTFGSFIRVQILFGIIAGIATWIIMSLLGIDFAASTSFVAGILTIIPLIGGLLALIPPVAIAFLIDPAKALLVLIALIAMQQIIFNIIFPRVIGKALQLHPVVVLLSFLIGYKVAGGFGVIFAVPVLGVLFVITHQIGHHFLEEKT